MNTNTHTSYENELPIYVRDTSVSLINLSNQIELGKTVSKELGLKPKVYNEGDKSLNVDDIEDLPILCDLLTDITLGKVKHLYVSDLNRLSRNKDLWTLIRRRLIEGGVSLYVGDGTKYDLSHNLDDFILGVLTEVTKCESH